MALKNENALKALLGPGVFDRFKKAFDECCLEETACCPSEVYTISVESIGCTDFNHYYTLTIVPNKTITGPLGITWYRVVGSTIFSGFSVYETGLVQNTPATIDIVLSGSTRLFLIDSRGNWSNTVVITVPDCPGPPPP